MKKYYQSVTICEYKGWDEFEDYGGDDRVEALRTTRYNNLYHDKYHRSETREYTLPDDRDFDELSDDEQCDVLSSYNIID